MNIYKSKQQTHIMQKEVYLKNMVRKIIEFNQKIDYFSKISFMKRSEKKDKELKKERADIIAQLDMCPFLKKYDNLNYEFNVDDIEMDLTLNDFVFEKNIKIYKKGVLSDGI